MSGLRTVLGVLVLVALGLGWYATTGRSAGPHYPISAPVSIAAQQAPPIASPQPVGCAR